MSENIIIKPCKNNVGAHIQLDIDAANPDNIKKIEEAVNDYGVVFFRNQNLTSEK